MSILPNFLRSLLLTSIFSFSAPAILIGAILVSLSLMGYIPHLSAIAQFGNTQISNFLAIFGSGSTLQGILVISCTCSLVGALFDAYAFYRYQNLRDS